VPKKQNKKNVFFLARTAAAANGQAGRLRGGVLGGGGMSRSLSSTRSPDRTCASRRVPRCANPLARGLVTGPARVSFMPKQSCMLRGTGGGAHVVAMRGVMGVARVGGRGALLPLALGRLALNTALTPNF
jgi:hypothetical protein